MKKMILFIILFFFLTSCDGNGQTTMDITGIVTSVNNSGSITNGCSTITVDSDIVESGGKYDIDILCICNKLDCLDKGELIYDNSKGLSGLIGKKVDIYAKYEGKYSNVTKLSLYGDKKYYVLDKNYYDKIKK